MRQDTIIAVLGLVVAVALTSGNLVIDHVIVEMVPPMLALSCLVYLAAGRLPSGREPGLAILHRPQFGLIAILYGCVLLVFVSVWTGGRTIPFYLGCVLLAALILLQILLTPDRHLHTGALLAQVLLLVAVLRAPALYTTPGFIGIDIWIHVPAFADGILESGSVDGIGQSKYVGSPLYHLLVAVTALFADVPLRSAVYLSVGIVMIAAPLVLYVATRIFLPTRWALFAAAVFGLADYAVRWSIHLIPTSLAIALFLGLLFFFLRRVGGVATTRDDLLLIGFMLGLVFTHQLSAFIVLVIFGGAVLAQFLYASRLFPLATASQAGSVRADVTSLKLLSYFVFNAGLLVFAWSQTPYYGQTFLEGAVTMLEDDITTLTEGGGGTDDETTVEPEGTPHQALVTYLDWVGYSLLLFGTAVGALVVTQSERLTQTGFVAVMTVGVLTGITLVPPVLGIDTFIPGRWYPFLYVFMAILAAIGFGFLRTDLAPAVFLVCALVFALAYPGAMIFATEATFDNPAFEEDSIRYGYTDSELAAAETVIERTTLHDDEPIFSDHPYVLVLNRLDEVRFGVATVDENGTVANDRVIYRSYQSTGAPRFDVGGDHHVAQVSVNEMCSPTKHRLYSNGDVHLCSNPG